METDSAQTNIHTFSRSVTKIPQLVCKEDVIQMINLQMSAIDRLEATNKSLCSCNILARDRLASTMKLFKRTAKQMNESKRDLDVVYKKVTELKNKIKTERPDLFPNESTHERLEEGNKVDDKVQKQHGQPQHQLSEDGQMDPSNARTPQRSTGIAITKSAK